jgi:hypothetical protein
MISKFVQAKKRKIMPDFLKRYKTKFKVVFKFDLKQKSPSE